MTSTPVASPLEFIKTRTGVEATIMRIGLHSTQLLLIAQDGEWLRFVVPSLDAARTVCNRLKLEPNEGSIPDHLRQRMANYKRTPEDWASAPYPERKRATST